MHGAGLCSGKARRTRAARTGLGARERGKGESIGQFATERINATSTAMIAVVC